MPSTFLVKNIIISIFLGLGLGSLAQAQVPIPKLSGPVIDQVGIISRSDERYLEQLLFDYNQKGKAQIQILVVETLGNETIENFSLEVTDKWKLGDAKLDNGILFVVAFKDRKMRLEVGQGLEGAMPDVVAKRIISDVVTPLFRAQKFSAGIVTGVSEIIFQVDAEYAAGNLIEKSRPAQKKPVSALLIFLALILITVIRLRLPFAGGGRYHGGWGGGGLGGGGGFGGSGGGGWSGGGGGFSGGGASGGW